MTYKDRTWCASPNCLNKCGRRMSGEDKNIVKRDGWLVSYSYFCGGEAEQKKKGESE